MSHKRRRHTTSNPTPAPRPSSDGFNELTAIDQAFKTYLNQEVALLRPQIGHAEVAHLARLAVTARAAVELRAESLRQVDFELADPDGNLLDVDTVVARGIRSAFQNNFKSVIERCEFSYCFYGEVLLRRLRNPVSNVLDGFEWINNNFFQRETNMREGLKGFRLRPVWGSDLDPDLDFIDPLNAVYMHTIDFFEDFGGVGPVMAAYAQAATETEMSATQLMFFRNMAMPNFIIQPASGSGYVPGDDQKNILTEYLRRMGQGAANAGRTIVSPSRWELLRFQQEFDKLGMPQLAEAARDAVVRILRVPIELLEPRQTTRSAGVKFYDQKREWLISWLVPQSERYADIFTEQIAKLVNPNWRIIPTFRRVRGLDEDISSRTDTVKAQVGMAVLDLLGAQKVLGLDLDENLKGIYLINGIPVPSSQFSVYHQYAPGNPGAISGGELAGMDKPQQTEAPKAPEAPSDNAPKTPNSSTQTSETKSIPFLGEAAYKEWRNWQLVVQRKGAAYPFEAKALPSHAVAYGRFLLSTVGATLDTWNTIRVQSTKTYDDTESLYRTALYNLMTDAFNGSLDRMQFGLAGRSEISTAFLNAFANGLRDGGVDPSEMSDEEKTALADEAKQERTYWTGLSNDMYGKVLPLKGSPEFADATQQMLNRIELWVNAGLRHVYDMGKLYSSLNGMKKWVYGGTVKHCASCDAAQGQVHRARTWMNYLTPRSELCLCTGINCDCALVDTTDRASGSLGSIPLAGGKHVHEEVLTAVNSVATEVAV